MVFLGYDISGIVRVQAKADGVVNIRPIGVVLLRLRNKSHLRHKSEGLGEVFELEFGLEFVVVVCPHLQC